MRLFLRFREFEGVKGLVGLGRERVCVCVSVFLCVYLSLGAALTTWPWQ